MAIDMQGQEVGDCASHQLSPSKERLSHTTLNHQNSRSTYLDKKLP